MHPDDARRYICPDDPPNYSEMAPGCRCGWPYTLLLPRDATAGLDFVFLALLTRGDDISQQCKNTRAVSYCGVLDAEFPDRRPMGFPFDRKILSELLQYIRQNPGSLPIKATTVKIRHDGQRASV